MTLETVAGWRRTLGLALAAAGCLSGPLPVRADPSPSPGPSGRALLDQYCVSCHNEKRKTAGLMLDRLDPADPAANADTWEKVVRKLRSRAMPPQGLPRPDDAAYDAFASSLEDPLDAAAAARPDPGRTEALHRLNRAEYQNAVRDLLALDVDAAALLPADDASYGFDNMAGVLRLSPVLLERYASAAQKISRVAVGSLAIPPTEDTVRVPSDLPQDDHLEGLPLGTRGGLAVRYTFPLDAEYSIRVRMARDYTDTLATFTEPHTIEVLLDGQRVQTFTIGEKPPPGVEVRPAAAGGGDGKNQDQDAKFVVRLKVQAGPREVAVAFVKKSSAQLETARQPFLRPLFGAGGDTRTQPYLGSVTISGPFAPTGPGDTPSRRRVFVCRPRGPAEEAACARRILSRLARRAYRRPVGDADLDVLLRFYRQGRAEGSFTSGIEMALRRLLVSPDFLFRIERDPARMAPATAYRLGGLELASRLSFFLWSSIPDEELLGLAARGKLREPAVLEGQVRRMLADPRAQALVTNFTGQWLYLRNLPAVAPDSELFPDFDGSLRLAFRRETELFFESMVREDHDVLDLLRADYTFLNERLARHYGVPNVYGSQFRRVALGQDMRSGLLGQGSILTVTSSPTRTSPVLRGKWILENLLGAPPPAPPPNVPALAENTEGAPTRSVRERLEQHRANAACASCHRLMDPLGFALENFDAVGQWRTVGEGNTPIDASGALIDGTHLDGPASLRQALLARPDAFVTTLTEKLLTYALGRGLESKDAPAVRAVAREAARHDRRFSSIVLGIVESVPFQMRRSRS